MIISNELQQIILVQKPVCVLTGRDQCQSIISKLTDNKFLEAKLSLHENTRFVTDSMMKTRNMNKEVINNTNATQKHSPAETQTSQFTKEGKYH